MERKKKEEKKPVDHTLKEDLNTIFFKVDVWPYPPNFNPFIRLPGNSHEALGILESLMIDPVTRVGRLVCRATEEVLPINGTFMPLDVISYFAKYGKEEWR